jgi:dihydrolipoamide dehydrogenase
MLADKDVIVIGGGPAGFMAAQVASMLGGKVTLVEKEKVGGICPNWGCIPMCFMEHCVEVLRAAKQAGLDGINVGKVQVDYDRLIGEKEKVAKGTVAGMEARLQATNVKVVIGSARLASADQVEITLNSGKREIIQANKIILATGSVARRYPIPGAYGPGVLTVKELLDLPELPRSLAIIGRSVTAVELATVWGNLGSDVSLIARKPQLLPNEDEELSKYVQHALEEEGVHMYLGVDVDRIDEGKGGRSITISGEGGKRKIEAQFAVFALGQQPCVDGLGLENAGINVVDGRIKTNERMETSVKGIYAAGDVTGEFLLASVAMVQGKVAAENAMGKPSTIDYHVVPRSARTTPPLAAVGITEAEAKEKGLNVKVGKFPFEPNPKARILRQPGGFVKIIADSTSDTILGVHIIGPQAAELIHEAAIIMKMKGTIGDIVSAIHGHPCLLETMYRAAQSVPLTR